jgi:hypothetical protein
MDVTYVEECDVLRCDHALDSARFRVYIVRRLHGEVTYLGEKNNDDLMD